MLRSQLEAELSARKKELDQVTKDYERVEKIINNLSDQLEDLAARKRALDIKILELEDDLDDQCE